ncbi:MAG: hypothetical protein H7841_13295 [Magnetospirillum sp. WYHS-4]
MGITEMFGRSSGGIADGKTGPKRTDQFRWERHRIGKFLFLSIFLVSVPLILLGGSFGVPASLRFLGLSALIASAAFAVGAFFGFLFGYPKGNPDAEKATPEGPSATVTNTNLDQISDWLTKLLVGASLASLAKVPDFLKNTSDWLGRYLDATLVGANGDGPALTLGAGVALVLVVLYSVFGFLSGFLLSRLWLQGAFERASSDASGADVVASLPATEVDGSPIDLQAAARYLPQEERKRIEALANISLDTVKTADEKASIGLALAALGKKDDAEKALREAASLNPIHNLKLAVQYFAQRKYEAAVGVLEPMVSLAIATIPEPEKSRIVTYAMLGALYLPPPTGYEKVFKIRGKMPKEWLTGEPHLVHRFLACANGQKYKYLMGQSATPEADLQAIADQAYEHAASAIASAPAQLREAERQWIRIFLNPQSDDPDLSAFADDQRFKDLAA